MRTDYWFLIIFGLGMLGFMLLGVLAWVAM